MDPAGRPADFVIPAGSRSRSLTRTWSASEWCRPPRIPRSLLPGVPGLTRLTGGVAVGIDGIRQGSSNPPVILPADVRDYLHALDQTRT